MKFSAKVLCIFVAFCVWSCSEKDVKSTDFTTDCGFTNGIEGPAVDKDGYLYAVNYQSEGTIGRVDKEGKASVFITLPKGSIGNGIRFDRQGNMFIADYLGHTVYRVKAGQKTPEVWARDSTMNQPNDLTIAPNGTIYLSDPNWAEGTGNLWSVGSDGIKALEKNMGTTNGIEVSPDGNYLYVNESVQLKVWRYRIGRDGSLSKKTEFISFSDYGLDGMRCDVKGNLYITRYDKGTVVIVDPSGAILKEIQLIGKKPSNIAFGGEDGKTCYVTMQDRGCIEQFPALNPGNYYAQTH